MSHLAETWLEFKIIAYSNAGNPAVKDNAGEYYTYNVIPEFPSWIILPLFLTATLFALIIKKRLFHPRS